VAGESQGERAFSLHQAGRIAEAIALYQELLRSEGANPHLLFLCGTALLEAGRAPEGLELLRRSLELGPNEPAVLANIALGLRAISQLEAALEHLDLALALKPDFAQAHFNRGSILLELKRPREALGSFDQAIALIPELAEAHNARGSALADLGRQQEALQSYQEAIARRPALADAHYNRGVLLQNLGRLEEALVSLDQAISLSPQADAHNHRGMVLRALDRTSEALCAYSQAIALEPDRVEAYVNRGVALLSLQRVEEAIAHYDRALAINPGYPDALWNKSLAKLLAGDFAVGWKLYESRWAFEEARNLPGAPWRGEWPVAGKTLLLFAEQGLGDVIQFCRYGRLLAGTGADIVLEVPAALVELVSMLDSRITVVSQGDPLPRIDAHCPLMSLPLALSTASPEIPCEIPYLARARRGSPPCTRALASGPGRESGSSGQEGRSIRTTVIAASPWRGLRPSWRSPPSFMPCRSSCDSMTRKPCRICRQSSCTSTSCLIFPTRPL
jgi:tetratricopeptide (TPR) repeat protein